MDQPKPLVRVVIGEEKSFKVIFGTTISFYHGDNLVRKAVIAELLPRCSKMVYERLKILTQPDNNEFGLKERTPTKDLLGDKYEETPNEEYQIPQPLQDVGYYHNEEILIDRLRFIEFKLRSNQELSQIEQVAHGIYEDACARLLEIERGLFDENTDRASVSLIKNQYATKMWTFEKKIAQVDSAGLVELVRSSAIQWLQRYENDRMTNKTRRRLEIIRKSLKRESKSLEEVANLISLLIEWVEIDEAHGEALAKLKKLTEEMFFIQYGDYFARVLSSLRKRGRKAGQQVVATRPEANEGSSDPQPFNAYQFFITKSWREIDAMRRAEEATMYSLSDTVTPLVDYVDDLCSSHGTESSWIWNAIDCYARRNDIAHCHFDNLAENGKFDKISKRISTDLEDLKNYKTICSDFSHLIHSTVKAILWTAHGYFSKHKVVTKEGVRHLEAEGGHVWKQPSPELTRNLCDQICDETDHLMTYLEDGLGDFLAKPLLETEKREDLESH